MWWTLPVLCPHLLSMLPSSGYGFHFQWAELEPFGAMLPPRVSRELEFLELWGPTPVLLLGGPLPITARCGTLKGQLPASNRIRVILRSNLLSKICPYNQTSSLFLSCFPYNLSGFPGSTSFIGHLLWHLYLSICFWGTQQNRWTIYWTFQRWEREPRGPEHLSC